MNIDNEIQGHGVRGKPKPRPKGLTKARPEPEPNECDDLQHLLISSGGKEQRANNIGGRNQRDNKSE